MVRESVKMLKRLSITPKEPVIQEATPLVPQRLSDNNRRSLFAGLCVGYIFCILPVSLPGALIPALEEDSSMQRWTPVTSGIYQGLVMWAMTIGALTIGWISDRFSHVVVMLSYVLCAGLLLHGVALTHVPSIFIGIHMVVFALKATAWPAAMAMLGTHLQDVRSELGILLVGVASRSGGLLTNVSMAGLLEIMDWRAALHCFGSLLLVAAVGFRGLISYANLGSVLESRQPEPSQQRQAENQPADAEALSTTNSEERASAPASMSAAVTAMVKDGSFWLMLMFAVGNEFTMGLSNMMGAFAHAVYAQNAAASAFIGTQAGTGEVLSLVFGIGLLLIGTSRRSIHMLILGMTIVGLSVTAVVVSMSLTVRSFALLGAVLNFATTFGGYIVVPTYCIEQAKRQGVADIALRITTIDGLATLFSSLSRVYVGYQRELSEPGGLFAAGSIAFLGCAMSITSIAIALVVFSDGYLRRDD